MNISELIEEFLGHFESPNEHEPYDSHEGGFYNSTLIETDDAVDELFPDLPSDVRDTLIGELNKISTSWVRKI